MLPTLATARLVLRPVTLDDVASLWTLWSNPAVRRFLWDDRTIDRGEVLEVVGKCQALETRGLGLWLIDAPGADAESMPPPAGDPIVEAPTRRGLGCAALLPASTAEQYEPALAGMIEPLVALDPACWGRGFAVEAMHALTAYAFETLDLAALAGVTDVPNDASDRMLRRAGFVPVSEVSGPKHRLRTYRLSRDDPGAK